MSQQRNLITDVPGVLVGNSHDDRLASGVTASGATPSAGTLATKVMNDSL